MASRHTPGARQRNVSPKAQEVTGIAAVSTHGTTLPEPSGPVRTEKVWNRLRHNGRLVRDEVTGRLLPMLRPLAWQEFQKMPVARCACWLMRLLERQEASSLYRRRPRRPAGAVLFDDIPSLDQRDRAEKIYAELCDRHSLRLPSCPWLRPVLAGHPSRRPQVRMGPQDAAQEGWQAHPATLPGAGMAPPAIGAKSLGTDCGTAAG